VSLHRAAPVDVRPMAGHEPSKSAAPLAPAPPPGAVPHRSPVPGDRSQATAVVLKAA